MHSIIDGDGLLYQAAYNVPNVAAAYKKFIDKIDQLATRDWDQDGTSTIFIEGKGNWRQDVFSGYKATRRAAKKDDPNKQLRFELGNFLVENKLVIQAKGMESDDLVRRKAETMRRRGQPYIVISADKDLDMVQGPHIRFDTKWKLQEYEVDAERSDYHYFYQLMVGDMTDNIKSPHLLGGKTAEKILKAPRGQWKSLVEKEYRERCGAEWFHALMFTGSLVHIQRWQGDMFIWDKAKGNFFDCGFTDYPTCYAYTQKQLGL